MSSAWRRYLKGTEAWGESRNTSIAANTFIPDFMAMDIQDEGNNIYFNMKSEFSVADVDNLPRNKVL